MTTTSLKILLAHVSELRMSLSANQDGIRVPGSPPQQEEGWPKAGVVWSSYPFTDCRIVELDGAVHEGPLERDETRTTYLRELEIRVMRFENRAVFESLELALN